MSAHIRKLTIRPELISQKYTLHRSPVTINPCNFTSKGEKKEKKKPIQGILSTACGLRTFSLLFKGKADSPEVCCPNHCLTGCSCQRRHFGFLYSYKIVLFCYLFLKDQLRFTQLVYTLYINSWKTP